MRICFQIILFILSTATFLVSCSSGEHGPSKQDTDQPTDIDKLNEQIAQNPDDATVYLNRGQYYYDAQVYSEAVSDFIRCVELDSSQVPCWHKMADAYFDDNRSRPAIESLEDCLKIMPNSVPTRLKLAEIQMIIKRYKAAHLHLDEILKKDQTNSEALFTKGLVYHYDEKPIQAVEYLQQAIQSDPDLADGHLLLGQLFEEAGNPMAKKYYDNAIRVDPDNAEAKMALANYFWMADDYDRALLQYQTLLDEHPDFARGYFNRGLIYLELDSLGQAEKSFESAITHDNTFIQAHYYLAETFVLKDEWMKAKSAILEARRLSPNDARISDKVREIDDQLETGN